MSTSVGPYQAVETYVHLGPDGTSVPLPVTDAFWSRLASGAFSHLGPGRLVSCYEFAESWTSWEMHPAGKEFVVLISGEMEFILSQDGLERNVFLNSPGQFFLVPRGAWHTAPMFVGEPWHCLSLSARVRRIAPANKTRVDQQSARRAYSPISWLTNAGAGTSYRPEC